MFYVYLALVSLGCVGLDQLSKVFVVHNLPYATPVLVLGDFLRLVFVYNQRGVFSLSFGPPIVYYLLPVIGVLLVIFLATKARDAWSLFSFGLILGGALGNLVDRIRLGKVIDFIDMGIGRVRWPTYNPADFFIVAGVVTLLFAEVFIHRKKK